MAVTYGHKADGNEDPFLARARELLNIVTQLVSPEKAAMFTAFPFRECLDAVDNINENIGSSRKVANVVLWWRLCLDETQSRIKSAAFERAL